MEKRSMVQDGHVLAVFNSAHRVMKAENILKRHKLPILLIPAPRALSTDCGLAIRLDPELFELVMRILTEEKMLPAFVCRRIAHDTYENMWGQEQSAP